MARMVIQVRNYQRIKKADFVFEPGLNVIVGASNNGKSSSLRAITTALFNQAKDSHVTIGETTSVVGIRYNGHDVIWKRDLNLASKNSYKIDGKTYTKLGKGQPKEVADALGIFEIDLDDSKERLNFQKQMAYPFLLDRTPSQVFKFMAQSAEEDNLMSIIDQMRTDQNAISVAIKTNEASMDSIKMALAREKAIFDKIKTKAKVCQTIINLDALVKKFSELESLISRIDILDNTRMLAARELIDTQKVLPVVERAYESGLPVVKQLDDLSDSLTYLDKIESVRRSASEEYQICSNKLMVFDNFPSHNTFTDMSQVWAVYSQGMKGKLDKSELECQIADLDNHYGLCLTRLETTKELLNKAEILQEQVSNLDVVLSQLTHMKYMVGLHEVDLKSLEATLKTVEDELKEFDVCPYCGSNLRSGEHGEH